MLKSRIRIPDGRLPAYSRLLLFLSGGRSGPGFGHDWRNEVVIGDHLLLHRRREGLLDVAELRTACDIIQLAGIRVEIVELQNRPRTLEVGALMLRLELTRLVSGEHLLPSGVGAAVHGPVFHLRRDVVNQLPALVADGAGQIEGGRFGFRPKAAVSVMQPGAEDVFARLVFPSGQQGKEAAARKTLRHRAVAR